MPEGGYLTNGNFAFRISYLGGTGNDITLTSTNISGPPAPTPGPRFWTGAGGNALWTNPANWSNNIAPVAGDTLFFHGAGFFEFIDADTLDFPVRFYRVRSP